MIDTTEMMIGDLVRCDKILFPVIITAIINFDEIMVAQEKDGKWIQLNVVDIEPIQITRQVIHANGWEEGRFNKIGELVFNYYIQLNNDVNSFNRAYYRVIIDRGMHNLCLSIRYIHELQHLLRLMDFGEIADAIKIA